MSETLKLAYFVAMKEGASYLGGLLLTDTSGIPIDFRYTEPITPTRLQGVLYGKALEPHLKEEVIQKTLLKELKSTPDLFILPPADMAICSLFLPSSWPAMANGYTSTPCSAHSRNSASPGVAEQTRMSATSRR